MGERGRDISPEGCSRDLWLGGKLILLQPRRGHRIGSDAAILAAACDPRQGRLVDVGAGVGAVGLAIVSRNRDLSADLVEIDPKTAALAADNAVLNDLDSRVRVVNVDACDRRDRLAAHLEDESAETVVTNPPFFDARAARVSPDSAKARAHTFANEAADSGLDGWIRACLALLKPGGSLVMIHTPEALAAILSVTERRLGALTLLPVYPRAGAAAIRLLISGIKGSRAPLRMAPPLVLHRADGTWTEEADALHRGARVIDWSR